MGLRLSKLKHFKGKRKVCAFTFFFTINHIVYVIILLSQAEKRKCF